MHNICSHSTSLCTPFQCKYFNTAVRWQISTLDKENKKIVQRQRIYCYKIAVDISFIKIVCCAVLCCVIHSFVCVYVKSFCDKCFCTLPIPSHCSSILAFFSTDCMHRFVKYNIKYRFSRKSTAFLVSLLIIVARNPNNACHFMDEYRFFCSQYLIC